MSKKTLCPLLKKPCIESDCKFWVHVTGADPQSGNPVDLYDCTFSWFPVLLIENTQQQRQTGAAVESFRNEVVKQNEQLLQVSVGQSLVRKP